MKKFVFGVFLILFFVSSSYLVYSDTVPDIIDGDTLSCGDIITNRHVRIIGGELNCGYGQDGLKLQIPEGSTYMEIYFEDTIINGDYGGSAGITIISDGSYRIHAPNINNFSVGIKIAPGVELSKLEINNKSCSGGTTACGTPAPPENLDSYIHGCDDSINITDVSFVAYSKIIINDTNFSGFDPAYAKNAININLNNDINQISIENNNFEDVPQTAIKIIGINNDVEYFDINNNYFENISKAVYVYNVDVINGLNSNYNTVTNTGSRTGTLFQFSSIDNPGSSFDFQNNVLDSNNPTQLYFTGNADRGTIIQSNQFNTNGLPISILTASCIEESIISGNTANGYPIFFYLPEIFLVNGGVNWSNSQQVELCGLSDTDFINILGSNVQNFRIRNSNNLDFDNVDVDITSQISISNSDNIKFNNSIIEKTIGTDETFYIYQTDNFGFYNGGILNSGTNKIYYYNNILSSYVSYLYNISDMESKIDFFSGFFDEDPDATQVYIGNNLKANITGLDNQSIENANVVIKNESGAVVYTGTTNYNGKIATTLFSHTKTRNGNGTYQQYSINTTKEDYHLNTITSVTLPNEYNTINISLNQIPLFGKIKIQPDTNEGYDTFVSTYVGAQQEGAGGNSDYDFLRTGYNSNYVYRSLLNFNLSNYPAFDSGLIDITSASLILTTKSSPTQNIDFDIYKIDSPWSQDIEDFDLTSTFIDGQDSTDNITINSGTPINTEIEYDVTSIVEDWVENGEENYGFLIKADDAASYVDFYSADASTFTKDKLPKLIIEYTIKDYINYEDTDITFNLSMFFIDDDELDFNYSYEYGGDGGGYTLSFITPILTMSPYQGYVTNMDYLNFSASDSIINTNSNQFQIDTLPVTYPNINYNNVHQYLIADDPTDESSDISFTIPYIPGAKECYVQTTNLTGFRNGNWGQAQSVTCGNGEQTYNDINAGDERVKFYKIYVRTNKNVDKFNPYTFGKISYDLSTDLSYQNQLFGFPFYNLNVSNSSSLYNYLDKYNDIKQIINVESNEYSPSRNKYDNFPINSNLAYKLIFDSSSSRYFTYAGIYNQTDNRTLSGLTTWIILPLNTNITEPREIFEKFNNDANDYKIKSISAYNVEGDIQRGTVYTPVSYVIDSILGETFELIPGSGIDIELNSSEATYNINLSST